MQFQAPTCPNCKIRFNLGYKTWLRRRGHPLGFRWRSRERGAAVGRRRRRCSAVGAGRAARAVQCASTALGRRAARRPARTSAAPRPS